MAGLAGGGGASPAAADVLFAIGDELDRGLPGMPCLYAVIRRGARATLEPVPVLPRIRGLPAADAVADLAERAGRGLVPPALARALRSPGAYGAAVAYCPLPGAGRAAAVVSCADRAGYAYDGIVRAVTSPLVDLCVYRPGSWDGPVHRALADLVERVADGGPPARPEPGL